MNDLTVTNPELIWLNSNSCLCKRAFLCNLLAVKPHNYWHDRSVRLQSYPSFSPFLLHCILLCSLPFCLQPLLIQLVFLLKTNTPTHFFRARMKMNGCCIKLTPAEFCINREETIHLQEALLLFLPLLLTPPLLLIVPHPAGCGGAERRHLELAMEKPPSMQPQNTQKMIIYANT